MVKNLSLIFDVSIIYDYTGSERWNMNDWIGRWSKMEITTMKLIAIIVILVLLAGLAIYGIRKAKKTTSSHDHKANRKEKEADDHIGVGIALGLGVGACFGALLDNMPLGIGIGLCIGTAIGVNY